MNRRSKYVIKHTVIAFAVIFVLLLSEWIGKRFIWANESEAMLLPKDKVVHMKETPDEKTCLLIVDTENAMSNAFIPEYEQILTDMRVGYDILDLYQGTLTRFEFIQRIENYRTVIISTDYYYSLQNNIVPLIDWVKRGGRLLLGFTPLKTDEFDILSPYLGITGIGDTYQIVEEFISADNYMLGAQTEYKIAYPVDSALQVELDPSCIVYAHTSNGLSLVWTRDYGKGRFVVCNFSYIDKAYRGIYASAYTLLEDMFVYPVINASTYYLDDFPSPTPSGDGEYVKRDYGVDIEQFYKKIWWPKVLELGEKHNIQYTGLIIETYEDNTDEDLQRNKKTLDHSYFGNQLINNGGELGFHGYNHQPLCGPEYVYEENFGYKLWETNNAMENSLDELEEFSKELFATSEMVVYVPPSDILSDEGRKILGEEQFGIRAIASIYVEGPDAYSQEFEVSEDGIVETPRVVSSCIITDYMKITAFGEMNLHYVQSHFMHPDDLLDPDRGAEIGWEKLSQNLDEYMTWVDTTAPDIRHLTGSGMAGAVQRYVNVTPEISVDLDSFEIRTEGLIDSAYYMIRATEDELVDAKGGKLTKLNGTLYLLEAQKDLVTITRK